MRSTGNSRRFVERLCAALVVAALAARASGVDSMSLAFGVDHNRNQTRSSIAGLQWLLRDGARLQLRADLTVAAHHSRVGEVGDRVVFDAGSAAVFALRARGNYFEFGSGPHALSRTVLGRRDMSSVFQMGSVFGIGREFGRWVVGYRYQHISNGEIVLPNEGLDVHALRVVRRF